MSPCREHAIPPFIPPQEGRELRLLFEILSNQLQHSTDTTEQAVTGLAADLLEIDRELAHPGRGDSGGNGGNGSSAAPERIARRVADALTRVQFQDTVKQEIATVTHALRQLCRYADQFADAVDTTACADTASSRASASMLLQDLYASYISEQQRAIHDSAIERTPVSPPASPTELF